MNGKFIFLAGGFPWTHKIHKLKISDYLKEYPKGDQSDVRMPLIVINHRNIIEIVYLFSRKDEFSPAFLSRKKVRNFPIFGFAMKVLQCLWVRREDSKSRGQTLFEIKERCEKYIADKKDLVQ